MSYKYIGEQGDFQLENPEGFSYLYFPLANENGVMSCVTPDLGGDSKINQNAFFMPPASCENLHNDKSSRNFWCRINQKELWSLTGRSGAQQAELFTQEKEKTRMEAGFMHHTITRTSTQKGLEATIQSVVPSSGESVEMMKVTLRNTGNEKKTLQIISAIPMYGRSADNIRDHRHVTTLLHRIETRLSGVVVNPTMTFDERGHQRNELLYGLFGGGEGKHPIAFYPTVEEFIGEGGNLENPRALYENREGVKNGFHIDGYEALGGLLFQEQEIEAGEKLVYLFVMSYGRQVEEMETEAGLLLNETVFDEKWRETIAYWQKKVNVVYHTGSREFDLWMRWVSFQPMLRRIYGCSFLPHHDYGKGGRGWRDLWQDCLALLLMNPEGVRQMLIDNFGGVRVDGTNATIIGTGSGEFIADRNHITRVWMDHGVWPFLTTHLYIQQTGDWKILLEENSYFKDLQVCRGEEKLLNFSLQEDEKQRTKQNQIYKGSILEHLLIQHLTAFFDVGEHNYMRIHGADWNDALDLASERGESIAFTMMYAQNMMQLAALLEEMKKAEVEKIFVLKELLLLLDCEQAVYDQVEEKRALLYQYCKASEGQISGEQVALDISKLQEALIKKAEWIMNHVRKKEWISFENGTGWYNGYYDNSGNAVEGEKNGKMRMMLTGQVFALMSGVALDSQVESIVSAADKYLYDAEVGGYRLNTDFKEIKMDFGRMFGFAYGHKENGAVFSHMTTMYGNALYQRRAAKEGYHVIQSLFTHCNTFEKSKIYPGIPEYIDAKGRGMYHYLTGAASWMLLTVVTQMFGVRGEMGNLVLDPQLLASQFNEESEAALEMIFADRRIRVTYQNKKRLEPEVYSIKEIAINGEVLGMSCRVQRKTLEEYPKEKVVEIIAVLEEEALCRKLKL